MSNHEDLKKRVELLEKHLIFALNTLEEILDHVFQKDVAREDFRFLLNTINDINSNRIKLECGEPPKDER